MTNLARAQGQDQRWIMCYDVEYFTNKTRRKDGKRYLLGLMEDTGKTKFVTEYRYRVAGCCEQGFYHD